MSPAEIAAVLDQVTFPGYRFEVGGTQRHWIRASFVERCSVTGREAVQHTRKWSVEHEARERFRYRGKAIYGPHFNVDALHRICESAELDYRGKTTP
ncbi:MAG: hypothetical protein E6Q67_05160 [Roseateles sp.]|nr:MAG: hypothetical protein E6Q67_05160 [Roseateles sp.]